MKKHPFILSLILFILIMASACSQTEAIQEKETVSASTENTVDFTGAESMQSDTDENPSSEEQMDTGEPIVLIEEPADECVICHTDKQMLMDSSKTDENHVIESGWEGFFVELSILESWEKVLVNYEAFGETVHGQIPCSGCHNGVQSNSKEEAHQGLVVHPSDDPQTNCQKCHPNIVAHVDNSLHSNLEGFWKAITARGGIQNNPHLQEMFGDHCASCHASCGDCHVSQPTFTGGGLIDGHLFSRTPSMTRSCTACHFSQVGNEYLGQHDGIEADVHFRQGQMQCTDCHDGPWMHGYPQNCQNCHPGPETTVIEPPDHRYGGAQSPRCESCHVPVTLGDDGIMMHEMHAAKLSCQVCHSVSYTSCDGCHVAGNESSGNPSFELESASLGFFIGRNALQSYDRPYEYVTVRHVPINRTSFEFYGDNLLPNYNNRPTWTYATPHNIQRLTPQTESCEACHNNPDLFLTMDKVNPEEVDANQDVIVFSVPPPVINLLVQSTPTVTTTEITAP